MATKRMNTRQKRHEEKYGGNDCPNDCLNEHLNDCPKECLKQSMKMRSEMTVTTKNVCILVISVVIFVCFAFVFENVSFPPEPGYARIVLLCGGNRLSRIIYGDQYDDETTSNSLVILGWRERYLKMDDEDHRMKLGKHVADFPLIDNIPVELLFVYKDKEIHNTFALRAKWRLNASNMTDEGIYHAVLDAIKTRERLNEEYQPRIDTVFYGVGDIGGYYDIPENAKQARKYIVEPEVVNNHFFDIEPVHWFV